MKTNITTASMSQVSVRWARLSAASAALFVVLFALLHIVEWQFDPSWRFISEYELGDYGWLMVIAFLSLAVSAGCLLMAIRSQIRTMGGYLGLGLLAVSIIGFVLAAVFTTDPSTIGTATTHGSLQSMGATLGGAISAGGLFLAWSLARNKAWRAARRSLVWISGVAVVGWAASIYTSILIAQQHSKFGPGLPVGWPNRIVIVAYAVWLLAMASLVPLLVRAATLWRNGIRPEPEACTVPQLDLTRTGTRQLR